MMNDRFSASLRQHLLDTANERPAEGQLASIVELVADTAQRPPIVVRLAGFPGRIGPFPSTAARWGLVAAALLGAALGVALLGGGAGPVRSTVFEGTWTSTDPGDGSRQILVVAAGTTPAVRFQDDLSTGGACAADDVKVFVAEGTGTVSENRLIVSFPGGGGCGLATVAMGPGFYDYDEATDRLTASADGVTWSRLQGPGGDPVIISSLVVDAPTGANSGTFETSGAARERGLVCPAGVATDLVEIDSAAIGSGELTDFTVPKELACDDGSGTIAITLEVHVDLASGTEWFSWVIAGGTGAYEGLSGEGYGSTRSPATDRYLNTYWGSVGTEGAFGQATVTLPPRPPTEPPATEPPATPTLTPAPTARAECIDLGQGGTFTALAGNSAIPVTATIPGTPAYPWHGLTELFRLQGSCDEGSPMGFHVWGATAVSDGGCMSSQAEIADFADAIARLDAPNGSDISDRIDLTIDGHPAARYDVVSLSTCSGFGLWGGTILGEGETGSIYVIDVDGALLEIELNRDGTQTPAELEEAHALIESLRFGTGGAGG